MVARARAALVPFPGRWHETLIVAGAVTVALGVAVALQVPSFAAPNLACFAMQHVTVCTWRNMFSRLLLLLVASVVLVPVGGVLVQVPWLLVPTFFIGIVTLTYVMPFSLNPIEAVLVAFVLVGVCFSGTYDPTGIAVQTRDLAAACAIGVVSATVFSRLATRPSARLRLTEALAASFERSRTIVREAMARRDAPTPPGGWPEAPVFTDLGSLVQLTNLARQEGLGPVADRTLVTLTTAAERIAVFAGTLDTLSRQSVPRVYRDALRGELDDAAADVERALASFAAAARALATHDGLEGLHGDGAWPDFAMRTGRLRERQDELRGTPVLATVDVTESVNVNSFVQSFANLGDVLHTPPWELRDLAADEQQDAARATPPAPRHLDPFALRFALQVGLGATIALVVGIAAHEPELSTLLWNPLLVAQMSYGATIRKAWLRLAGVIGGGVLSLLTMVVVFANTGDLTALLTVVFVVVAACQYAALGMPVTWYAPFQATVTYFVVLIAAQPTTDVAAALWRTFGTFVGTAILFAVFRLVAPDYAGRQLVARFADLLRLTLRNLPPPGGAWPTSRDIVATRAASSRASADILRLIGESRLEGDASGVAPDAAVEAAGVALRVSLRAGLVARGRVMTARPEPVAALAKALDEVRDALRAHVALDLAMVDARQTMAAPGTRAHDVACAAARASAVRERPELQGPLEALLAEVARARRSELMDWTTEQSGALLAEVDHLRRMAQLVPRLDAALERMILPDPSRLVAHATAPTAAPLASGAATT